MRVSLCLLTVWLFLACVGRGEIVPIPSWSKSMAKEKYILTPKAPEVSIKGDFGHKSLIMELLL